MDIKLTVYNSEGDVETRTFNNTDDFHVVGPWLFNVLEGLPDLDDENISITGEIVKEIVTEEKDACNENDGLPSVEWLRKRHDAGWNLSKKARIKTGLDLT